MHRFLLANYSKVLVLFEDEDLQKQMCSHAYIHWESSQQHLILKFTFQFLNLSIILPVPIAVQIPSSFFESLFENHHVFDNLP